MTNGRYKSVEHRAITDRCRARLSIPVFYSPEFEAEIGPALELIDETHPCLFNNFIYEDYMKHYLSRGQRESIHYMNMLVLKSDIDRKLAT